jgi:peptidyl-tRNA hydrolase
MKIKVLYRRNLKMTPGKLAAQTGHAVLGLQPVDSYTAIVVLAASDKKFFEKVEELKGTAEVKHNVVTDAGLTEVEPGTNTCLAFIEES